METDSLLTRIVTLSGAEAATGKVTAEEEITAVRDRSPSSSPLIPITAKGIDKKGKFRWSLSCSHGTEKWEIGEVFKTEVKN